MGDSEQRRRMLSNWLRYHWLWLTVGGIGLFLLGHLIWSGITAPRYDLQVAIIAGRVYPDPVLDQLAQALTPYAADLDGNGKTQVNVVQYVVSFRTENDAQTDARTRAAGVSGMLADLRSCETQVFIVEDPDGFSRSTGALRYRDGTLPADDVYPVWQETCYRWQDCPVLAGLPLGDYDAVLYGGTGHTADWFQGLYIGSRGFWEDTATRFAEGNEAFWQALTTGATG